jgi:N-carbamoylputrescine amidase
MSRPWRIAAIQLPGCGADPIANRETAAAYVREAARLGADLALLPELATVPFFCSEEPEAYRHLAETVDGGLVALFSRLCRQQNIALVLPFYERDGESGRYYNSVVVLGRDGSRLVAHGRRGERPGIRKLHLPVSADPPPSPDESRHFTPGGDLGVFDLGGLRLGCLICYDRRFPECWRELRALGSEIVAVPIAGEGGDSVDFFLGELRTHARENGVVVISANKIGREFVGNSVVENFGESCIVSATGEVVGRRPGDAGPGVVLADIDLDEIVDTRRRLPYFDQRRLDLFPGPLPASLS